MTSRGAAAFALLVALAACDPEPRRLPVPVLPEVPTLPPTARPWRVHGAAENAHCAGASIDPPDAELARAADRAAAGEDDAAYAAYLGLAVTWPRSATVRVRAATLAEESRPARESDAAHLYGDALALDHDGCGLPPRELWLALRGVASLHARSGEWAAAIPFLERAKEAFPGATPTRYELAAARCETGDLARCGTELEAVLSPHEEPEFVRTLDERAPEAWRELAARDATFAPLRREARWQPLFVAAR